MLINLSNHPSSLWGETQTSEANVRFGEIIDLPFPVVDPAGDEKYIQALVEEYIPKIQFLTHGSSRATVHIMGELTFTFAMVAALQKLGVKCLASTTNRITTEENGLKTSEFRFVKFREYGKLQ
jgi:hypothetical protein